LWLCSSGSTYPSDNHLKGCTMDIWRGMTDSTGSSRSHQGSHRNRIRCAFSDHESSLRASHLLSTKHGGQCRKEYEKNPVARRKNGARSAVGCVQYRSQHRGGNRPINLLDSIGKFPRGFSVYPHCSMESPSNLIILLQSRTASKNLWQPKLSNSSLHVPNLSLRWRRRLYPL
jgi:hypothetical protein